MKTTVITSNGIANNGVNNKATGANAAGAAQSGNSAIAPNQNFDKTAAEKDGKVNGSEQVKEAPKAAVKDGQVASTDGKKEEAKTAPAAPVASAAPALNLDSTIKLALDLNRRINQRGKLLETISTLEGFEVAQQDEVEETDTNFYQGCTLSIEDDKGREFTTKNPFIIKAVAVMVNTLCVDKLAEIEAEIRIPA